MYHVVVTLRHFAPQPQFSELDCHVIQSLPTDGAEPAPSQPRDPTAPRLHPHASPALKRESFDVSATSEGELARTLVASGGGPGETARSSVVASAAAKGMLCYTDYFHDCRRTKEGTFHEQECPRYCRRDLYCCII